MTKQQQSKVPRGKVEKNPNGSGEIEPETECPVIQIYI